MQQNKWVATVAGPARRKTNDGSVELDDGGVKDLLGVSRGLAWTHYDYDVAEQIQKYARQRSSHIKRTSDMLRSNEDYFIVPDNPCLAYNKHSVLQK